MRSPVDRTAAACQAQVRGFHHQGPRPPPRQSEPLEHEAVLKLELGSDPLSDDGPVNPMAVHVLSTCFMLREIEASLALRRHVSVDYRRKSISWLLPVSKNDPQARGCTRSWSCSCWQQGEPWVGCPYHCMIAHLVLLSSLFGSPKGITDDTPLFPNRRGRPVTASAMLQLIELLATMIGLSIFDKDGYRVFGKHSWKSTGAVWLSLIGL